MARILIIDDDVQIRGMLRRMLGRAGHEAVDAPDGKAGMRLYREEPADLIIMDLIMPDKDGLETIRELRRDFPDAKIIAISGGGRAGLDEYLRMAKNLGALRTFTKPFDRKEMIETVRELVGGGGQENEKREQDPSRAC